MGDQAVLGAFDTEFRSGLTDLLSLNGTGQLTVSGGTLQFSTASAIGSLLFTSGTIGGTGSLAISGAGTWSGGSMVDAGSTTFNGALALSGDNLRIITERGVNFAGTTTWTNSANGNQGSFYTGSGATLTNSGTFLDQTSADTFISNGYGGAASSFVNTGTYTKSGASNTDISIGYNNAGTLNVNAGVLNLGGGGSSDGGTFSVASGATLNFSGGTHTLNNIALGTGSGRMLVSGGTVNSTGTLSFAGVLGASGGTFNANGVANAAGFEMTSGTIGGTGSLAISGAGTWSGGSMVDAGSTTFNGALALSGDNLRIITERGVNFAGTTTWTNSANGNQGSFYTGSGATLTNSGTFLDQTSADTFISNGYGGAASSFVNTGTYTKSGATTTTIGLGINNSGAIKVNAGTLNLGASGTSGTSNGGSFDVASGATINFVGGTQTLNNIVAGTGTGNGRMLAASGTVNATGTMAFNGAVGASSGVFNFNGAATAGGFEQTGGTIGGTGSLTVSGPGTWSGGSMVDAGSTTFNGALALSGDNLRIITERGVNFAGTTTWTNSANGNQGSFYTGSGATLTNSGTFLDQTSANTFISNGYGGAESSFVNTGTYTKSGAGTTDIAIGFNNSGSLNVNAGVLSLSGGLSNLSGTTLTGGTYQVSGSGVLQFIVADIATNAATIVLEGAGSTLLNGSTNASALANFASNTAAGRFTIRYGRDFSSVGAFDNAGVVNVGINSQFTASGTFSNQSSAQLQMAGGSFAGSSLSNAGLVTGFGSAAPAISNTGSVVAAGGDLTLTGGVQGAAGALTIASYATLNLGSNSSAATLSNNGALVLGPRNITVHQDYSNASFGVGNAFNRRAAVSGSGSILAAGTTQQTLSGALVQGGSTVSATLALPNIRVGQGGVTTSFAINNVGAGGPSLRGAVQTTGITNAALSGSGVTAQNWGALQQGSSSPTFSVTFNPLSGQSLSGQTLQVVNNFDNVAGQTLAITGSAFNLASASAAALNPVVLASQRVGGALTQTLTIGNTAAANGFSEALNASIAANGTALAGGSFNLLAAGSSSSALFVGVDTSSAGAKSGAATITLASDGTGTSGFSPLGIASQQVSVFGKVYAPAIAQLNTTSVNFGIVHVGDSVASRNVSVSNIAPAAGLNDVLVGSISGTSASPFIANGALGAGVVAGGTDATSLTVGLDTSSAGVFSKSATVSLASHNADMTDLGLGNQSVALSGQVNNFAQAAFGKTGGQGSFSGLGASFTLDFGTLLVGASALNTQLAVFNTATGLADALRGSFNLGSVGLGDNFTLGGFGSFAGVAAGGSYSGLSISFGSSLVGSFDEVIILKSAGTNGSGYDGVLGDVALHLHGNVAAVAAVPEPETYMLMAGGLVTVWLARRRSTRPSRLTREGVNTA